MDLEINQLKEQIAQYCVKLNESEKKLIKLNKLQEMSDLITTCDSTDLEYIDGLICTRKLELIKERIAKIRAEYPMLVRRKEIDPRINNVRVKYFTTREKAELKRNSLLDYEYTRIETSMCSDATIEEVDQY